MGIGRENKESVGRGGGREEVNTGEGEGSSMTSMHTT